MEEAVDTEKEEKRSLNLDVSYSSCSSNHLSCSGSSDNAASTAHIKTGTSATTEEVSP